MSASTSTASSWSTNSFVLVFRTARRTIFRNLGVLMIDGHTSPIIFLACF